MDRITYTSTEDKQSDTGLIAWTNIIYVIEDLNKFYELYVENTVYMVMQHKNKPSEKIKVLIKSNTLKKVTIYKFLRLMIDKKATVGSSYQQSHQ